jgi:signal transduction histidine kinase
MVAVAIAFCIRLGLDPLIVDDDAPFILLLGAVMASAYISGVWSGLVAIVLGMSAASAFMYPTGKVLSAQSATSFELASFLVEAVLITMLCEALHRARLRAERSAEEARSLQREVSDAAEREQRRIGQDLHDDLGQFLTGIALSGELLARRMDRERSPHTEDTRKLVHMVNESVNRTRQLARGLSPMAVDPDSLPLLLAELQERSAELSGKDVTIDIIGDSPDLSHEEVLHLYRIAQEAVSNALKHSGGTRIEIILECFPDFVTLSICDNGNGSGAVRPAQPSKGMGMRVMDFRARTIGASLTIKNRENGPGTSVVCTLKTPVETGRASIDGKSLTDGKSSTDCKSSTEAVGGLTQTGQKAVATSG